MNHKSNTVAEKEGVTLVLGGTGKTGRRIAERLRKRGVVTRIASRSATPSFDWSDSKSWDGALKGVTAAYISYAPDLAVPGAADAIRSFTERAAEHGVERLVLLSGRGEEEAQFCERIVQEAGIAWTIVRASWFNQNFSEGEFLGMVLDGVITIPAGNTPEPFVDVNDIADVAVAALTEKGHAGRIYEVTGPRLLTFTDIADEISRASRRNVDYVRIPAEDFATAIADAGVPDDTAWLLNYLFSTVLDGRNAYVGNGVQEALGRPPTDFTEFARNTASLGIWDNATSSEREAA